MPIHPLLNIVLRAADLDRPDGRRLYRYHVSQRQTALIRDQLCWLARRAGWDALNTHQAAALFVLGAAELIRCSEDPTGWRWLPICNHFGLPYEPSAHRVLAGTVRCGLAWWRRRVFEGEHAKGYLKTLVFESGIPTAAAGPWLQRWVVETARSVRRGQTPAEAADTHSYLAAVEGGPLLAPAVAELAEGMARIVANLPPAKDRLGVEAVAWLDARHPGWRHDLGISLPDAVADGFLRGVLGDLTTDGGRAGRIAVSRLLVLSGTEWVPSIRLDLAGTMPSGWAVEPLLRGRSRARIHAAGALLERVQGPLAILVLDRGEDGTSGWMLKPMGRARLPLALTDPASIVVATDGMASDPIVLAHGLEPDAPLLVFEPDPDDRDRLVFRAAGSCRLSAPEAIVAVPTADADLIEVAEGAEPFGHGVLAGYSLWRIRQSITLPDGLTVRLQEPAGSTPLLRPVGPTMPHVRGGVLRRVDAVWAEDAGGERRIRTDRLRWRQVGTRTWHAWGRGPVGNAVIAQVESGGVIGGDVRVRVAPPGLDIHPLRNALRLTVGDGTIVRCPAPEATVVSDGERATVRITLPPVLARTIPVTLVLGEGSTLALDVDDPRVRQAFTDPAGRIQTGQQSLALPCLHGWTAVARQGGALTLTLYDRDNRAGECIPVRFEQSRPFLSFVPAVRGLIGLAGNLDATVRVEWLGTAGSRLDLRLYDHQLAARDGCLQIRGEPAGHLQVAAMPLLDPAAVETLYDGEAGRRPEVMAPVGTAGGPWLAWATLDGIARIRPALFLHGEPDPALVARPMGQAVAVADAAERMARITACLHDPATRSEAVAHVRAMLNAVAGRAPACALDPVRALALVPDAAVALLAASDTSEEIGDHLALDEELPLLWAATRWQVWRTAFTERRDRLRGHLSTAGLPVELADRAVADLLRRVALLRPGLSMHAAIASPDMANALAILRAPRPTADDLRAELVQCDEASGLPCPHPVTDLAAPLDPAWHGAATAPAVAAQIATEALAATPVDLGWLWRVQAVIPSWFERAVLFELHPHFVTLAMAPAQ